MTKLTILFILLPIISGLLLFINLLFGVNKPDLEKISPFECGFHGFTGQTRSPFSISFYLVGILFLIFDLEIAFLYPYIVSINNNGLFGLIIVLIFIFILALGFIYEYSKGALVLHEK